jgi:hypothetical protein
MEEIMKKILLSAIILASLTQNVFAQTPKEFLKEVKDFKHQIKIDVKNKTNDAQNLETFAELNKNVDVLEAEIKNNLENFYSDRKNREFLLRTKRIQNINTTFTSGHTATLLGWVDNDKFQHTSTTMTINEVLKGITNEDKPFIAFILMTLGKEVIWDFALNKGNPSVFDAMANAAILPLKVDYKEMGNDLKSLSPKNIKQNGIKKTVKGFMINERKSPEELRKIRADYDNLYKAQLELLKVEKELGL